MLWGRNTLSLLHWNHMTYADHLVWPIHVPRRCEPLITPHLSLWGNSRTRATFPTHKKSHNPHPQRRGGRESIWVHYIAGGWGGCLPNLDHICIYHTCLNFDHILPSPEMATLSSSRFPSWVAAGSRLERKACSGCKGANSYNISVECKDQSSLIWRVTLPKTNMDNDGLEQESALLGVHVQVSCQFVRIIIE